MTFEQTNQLKEQLSQSANRWGVALSCANVSGLLYFVVCILQWFFNANWFNADKWGQCIGILYSICYVMQFVQSTRGVLLQLASHIDSLKDRQDVIQRKIDNATY